MNDMYPEIKTNLIERFFNPLYRYTSVSRIGFVVNDMNKHSPFPVKLQNENTLLVDLGDKIFITINMTIKKSDNHIVINQFT